MSRLTRHTRTWPRLYVQLIATGEIFEYTRGEYLSEASFASFAMQFGGAWVVWVDGMPARGTGRPPRAAQSEAPV